MVDRDTGATGTRRSDENARRRFEEWQRHATDDERIVELALREKGPPNPICFLAQQIAEKYLKGFLAYHKRPPEKVHALDRLLEQCEDVDRSFSVLRDEAVRLSAYYTAARYPGDIPEFSPEECRQAYEAARRIKNFVLGKLPK